MKIDLTVKEIIKGQGADPEIIASRKPALIKIAELALEMGKDLISPRSFTRTVVCDELISLKTIPQAVVDKNLEMVAERTEWAISYVLAVCTIGDGLEKLSERVMATDFALALALDGMANAAIDRLVEYVFHDITDDAELEGLGASLPVSPGSHAWPLEIGQPFIFDLLKPDPAIVRLNDSFLMLPRKSASFIMDVGPQVSRHGKTCDYCSMAEDCRYRIRKTF